MSFFPEAVEVTAEEAHGSIVAIAARIAEDRKRVLELGTSTLATLRLFERLPTMPRITIDRAARVMEVSAPTAAKAIQGLQDAGVLRETTGRSRNQSFLYVRYVQLLV